MAKTIDGTVVEDFVPHDLPWSPEPLRRMKARRGFVPWVESSLVTVMDSDQRLSGQRDEVMKSVRAWAKLWDELEAARSIRAVRVLMELMNIHRPARAWNDGEQVLTCAHCYEYDDTVGIPWPCETYRRISETK